MKYGYLEFRYGKRTGGPPESRVRRDISINIGDNIQSLAVRNLFRRIGIADEQMVGIDRDDLAGYAGEPVVLLMNGCFYKRCFPLPERITPMFFGFNTDSDSVIKDNRALFEKHAPIGCRDTATMELMTAHGIPAYVSGCATLTLDRRAAAPERGVTIISHGSGSGEFPGSLLEFIPPPLIEGANFVFQRHTAAGAPLDDLEVATADGIASSLLEKYRETASLVTTPLLHVASPCLGMGIPVILARKQADNRFTAIDRLVPVYTPETFASVDWYPQALDLEDLKLKMAECVQELIASRKPDKVLTGYFSEVYAKDRMKSPAPPLVEKSRRLGLLRNWIGRR